MVAEERAALIRSAAILAEELNAAVQALQDQPYVDPWAVANWDQLTREMHDTKTHATNYMALQAARHAR